MDVSSQDLQLMAQGPLSPLISSLLSLEGSQTAWSGPSLSRAIKTLGPLKDSMSSPPWLLLFLAGALGGVLGHSVASVTDWKAAARAATWAHPWHAVRFQKTPPSRQGPRGCLDPSSSPAEGR